MNKYLQENDYRRVYRMTISIHKSTVVYGQLALQVTQQGRADLPRQWEPTRRACLLVVTNGRGKFGATGLLQ